MSSPTNDPRETTVLVPAAGTSTATASDAPGPGSEGRHAIRNGADAPPDMRGSTTIADRVVQAMAAQIAGEVDQVGGAARRMLGVSAGREGAENAVRVDADVRGGVCSLRVRLSVCYPAPVAQVTEHVRQQLIDRLATLAGLQVRRVEITVTALHSPQQASGREIR